MRGRPPAQNGGPPHEVRVGRRADAHGKKPALTNVLLDVAKERLFIADRAIGNKNHLADLLAFLLARKRELERRHHLCAAFRLEPV